MGALIISANMGTEIGISCSHVSEHVLCTCVCLCTLSHIISISYSVKNHQPTSQSQELNITQTRITDSFFKISTATISGEGFT